MKFLLWLARRIIMLGRRVVYGSRERRIVPPLNCVRPAWASAKG